ncbi:amidohydrolase family protein [Jiangella alba]|uniref:5-methylthioadenosine/S-adenosylhomocysteine deaminase n=1 Tax=Jiangella alba TaxID=561176 RepID=A0A1H5KW79_9ACTN|nr:amidohydrolase [Jiangella alba]SEE68208.1 5-methylthioadenosine/S-adenosylhomocysteine deaminase [Jiangella alba]
MSDATRCDLLLTGGAVVTMDAATGVVEDGAVAVLGDRVSAVGTAAELAGLRAARTVDCRGTAVLPGLVDTHTHLYQGLARSLGEGMPLWSWLADFMWPYAAALTREDARVAALLGAVEAARAGTTALLDHHYAPADPETVLAVAAAVEAVGLRGVVARGMAGTPSAVARDHGLDGGLFAHSTATELELTRACVAARPPGSRVEVWPGPHNVTYADQELLRGSAALARELGTGWHAHCASTPRDPEVYRGAYGTTPVAWLHEWGLLGPRTTLAHGIHLSDAEVRMVGETGTAVAHCPVSNQYGADGVLRLRELRAAGAVVALGTDGAAYNHRQDLFECMKQAVLVQRLHRLDPDASRSGEALALATREGARLLGVDAGVLAPGRLADVTVVGLGAPHLTPHHDVGAALVYAARGSDVRMTIVGGEVVVEDGRCVRVDEDAIVAEALDRARAVARRAGIV